MSGTATYATTFLDGTTRVGSFWKLSGTGTYAGEGGTPAGVAVDASAVLSDPGLEAHDDVSSFSFRHSGKRYVNTSSVVFWPFCELRRRDLGGCLPLPFAGALKLHAASFIASAPGVELGVGLDFSDTP